MQVDAVGRWRSENGIDKREARSMQFFLTGNSTTRRILLRRLTKSHQILSSASSAAGAIGTVERFTLVAIAPLTLTVRRA